MVNTRTASSGHSYNYIIKLLQLLLKAAGTIVSLHLLNLPGTFVLPPTSIYALLLDELIFLIGSLLLPGFGTTTPSVGLIQRQQEVVHSSSIVYPL